jgi:hypothetical protein
LPPASGLVNIDPWIISAVTNDINLVGEIPVTFTVKLTSYNSVPFLKISFNIFVGDRCSTATIDNKGQNLSKMSFVARFPTPST